MQSASARLGLWARRSRANRRPGNGSGRLGRRRLQEPFASGVCVSGLQRWAGCASEKDTVDYNRGCGEEKGPQKKGGLQTGEGRVQVRGGHAGHALGLGVMIS